MENSIINVFLSYSGDFFASGYVFISVCDTAYVFHSAVLVVGTEDLIKLPKWIRATEHLLIPFYASACDAEPILGHFFHILNKRISAEKAEWHLEVRVIGIGFELIIRPCYCTVQISRYRL